MNTQGAIPGGVPVLLELTKGGTTSITVPANRMYYLAWFHANYVCDATVVNRTMIVNLTLTNTATCRLINLSSMTASGTWRASFNTNLSLANSPNNQCNGSGFPLPMYPGQKLELSFVDAQAGDSWTIEGVLYEVALGCP